MDTEGMINLLSARVKALESDLNVVRAELRTFSRITQGQTYFKLCYVSDNRAWFTTAALTERLGDDWDDGWYATNASEPYERDTYSLMHIYYTSHLATPEGVEPGCSKSVLAINAGVRPWLTDGTFSIMAGVTPDEFKHVIRATGGKVFVEDTRT